MAVYRQTMSRIGTPERADGPRPPEYNGQPWRTLQQLADVLGVEYGVLKGLLQKYRENAPQLTRMGTKGALYYNRGAFRDWWRTLPAEVREKAKMR